MTISSLSATAALARIPELSELLIDAIENGAAVGFMPPLTPAAAEDYWQEVIAAVEAEQRVLLVAETEGRLCGTLQLDLVNKPNGLHRAEVMKMLVHSRHRRQGIARQLLEALEEAAQHHQRTTLVLDTRRGDVSELLYQSMGYVRAGEIPQFARSGSGEMHATVLYYKLLGEVQ
ncbi:GNAT family N-acetyltransferase [Hymenobacter koreensis]|uniref:GNAT family N-acetyltransferase n=1 Tax=Hymenobacter koreensis TaxID=1084523 RepID=A0ABP8J085_9BACT